jgi:hypothetical protein
VWRAHRHRTVVWRAHRHRTAVARTQAPHSSVARIQAPHSCMVRTQALHFITRQSKLATKLSQYFQLILVNFTIHGHVTNNLNRHLTYAATVRPTTLDPTADYIGRRSNETLQSDVWVFRHLVFVLWGCNLRRWTDRRTNWGSECDWDLSRQAVIGDRWKYTGRCPLKPRWSRSIGRDDVGMVVGVYRGEETQEKVLINR